MKEWMHTHTHVYTNGLLWKNAGSRGEGDHCIKEEKSLNEWHNTHRVLTLITSERWNYKWPLPSIIKSVAWIILKFSAVEGPSLLFSEPAGSKQSRPHTWLPSSRVKSPLPTPVCPLRICSLWSRAQVSAQRPPSLCAFLNGQELSPSDQQATYTLPVYLTRY